MEQSFTLNFLEEAPSIDMEQECLWSPKQRVDIHGIQTATFSGKNQADDYTNE